MNDVPTHVVTFCPHCSTGLRVRSATRANGSGVNDAMIPSRPKRQTDRTRQTRTGTDRSSWPRHGRKSRGSSSICPECAATLRVRQSYVGHRVACKQCAHTFIASSPTESPLHPAHACPPATTATAWIERRAPWARGSTSRRGSNQAGLHSRNVPTRPEDRGAIRPIRAVLPPTPAYWPGLAGSVSMPVTVELMAFGSDRLD